MILLIVFIAAASARKGLLLSLMNILSLGLAFTGAKIGSRFAAQTFYDAFIRQKVIDRFYEIMPSGSVKGEITGGIQRIIDSLPSALTAIAKQFGLYPDVGSADTSLSWTCETIENEYVRPLASGVLTIIAMMVLFVILLIILRLIFRRINGRLMNGKHKIIGKTNMILGGVAGLFRAVIPVGFISAVACLIAPAVNNAQLTDLVSDSFFCETVQKFLS